jgi:DNA polymerase-3 subunit beta
MEFIIKREDLVRGLYLVQGVVERRTTQPILSNVLLEPVEGGIALTATDLEVGLRCTVPAQVRKKGSATVSARKLYEISREVVAEEVTIKTQQAGWVEVLAGRSKFKIVSLDAKEFPEFPLRGDPSTTGVSIRLTSSLLREMIDRTLFAVSSDDTRLNLSGVFLTTGEKGTLRMVATDGHRLAMVDRKLGEVSLERGVILPRKGLAEARKLLDEAPDAELTLMVSSKDLRMTSPTMSFFMRLLEAEFPDYRQVIPAGTRIRVRANRDDFLAALRRISLLASERSRGVKLSIEKGRLEISASNPDQGEASEDIEVAYGGEALSIGFNARYLMDVLGVHGEGEVVELALTDEVGPGVLRSSQDPDFTYVVMPMRL